jgi:hypothetical protein
MRPTTMTERLMPWHLAILAIFVAIPLSANSAGVDYRHKNFVLPAPAPSVAELPGYQARSFDNQTAQSRSLTAAVGGDNFACPLAFQDVARSSGNGEQGTVAIVGYRGCPFDLGYVSAESWLRLREPITIDIAAVRGGVVYTSERSIVPFAAERDQPPYVVPTAIGVTWRFKSRGVRFKTQAGQFVTDRPGATIAFTGRGVKFKGFSSVPRSAGVPPSTNGWARGTMQAVQGKLTGLGYDPGPIDGLWGKRTRDAILAFQQRAGIDATGTLDSITLEELGI